MTIVIYCRESYVKFPLIQGKGRKKDFPIINGEDNGKIKIELLNSLDNKCL